MGKDGHWTEKEDRYMREKYPDMSTAEIARKLNRSETAIRQRACKLGIVKMRRIFRLTKSKRQGNTKQRAERKRYNPNPITPLTCQMVCWYTAEGDDVKKIAALTHRPVEVIQKILDACLSDGRYEKYINEQKGKARSEARETGRIVRYMKQM